MELLKSAKKVVLLMFSLTLCIGVGFGKISNEAFISLAGVVLWFYFWINKDKEKQSDLSSTKNL